MARDTTINLYDLLPAFHRIDDDEQGYPLRALLEIISKQANLVREDIGGLWDDFFIETCADWVIPYIGDLVGNNPIYEAVRGRRADVAKTIYYRRRKGTLPMLEELARDITGWGAHAVAFFELLGWTQNLNHLRYQVSPDPGGLNPYAVDRVGTAHLRNLNAIDLLEGPFQITTHTVDVRKIRQAEGWYNIRNIGFFLWRLQAYRMLSSVARQSALHPHGYHFNPLGHPAPLFTHPLEELAENGLSTEFHVPGPIRPFAFHSDLEAADEAAQDLHFLNPPAASTFYGDQASLLVTTGGVRLPHEIGCADLSAWERPPAGFSGLFSAPLPGFAGLSDASPEVAVTIGEEGPETAAILGAPANLNNAAVALQTAIRGARKSTAFAGTRVLVIGNRLLIIPGVRGASVTFAATAGDAASVAELGLNAGTQGASGVFSGDLSEFPTLFSASLELSLAIGAAPPVAITLAPTPVNTLAVARQRLELAIQGAGAGAAFTGAVVLIVEDRLLVLPGVDGEVVVLRRTAGDPSTIEQLKLASKIAVDVRMGRLAFPIGHEPADPPVVNYTYGFSSNMGGGPYDRRRKPARLGQQTNSVEREDTVRDPEALDVLIRVPSGAADIPAAVALWDQVASPRAVIQVDDSRTYFADIAVNLTGRELIIQSANFQRPAIVGDIDITAGGGDRRMTLNGFWVEGQVRIVGNLGELRLFHSTLVPGLSRTESNQPAEPDAPSLIVDATNNGLLVEIDHSITGFLQIPADVPSLTVADSILDSPRARGGASVLPALVSGDLSAFPALAGPTPTFLLTIGDTGPHPVVLVAPPADLPGARAALETAIHAAGSSEAFTAAQVIEADNRLILLPGAPGELLVQPDGTDTTAADLLLDPPNSRSVFALASGDLTAFPALTAPVRRLRMMAGLSGPVDISIPVPASIAQLRTDLEIAIQANAAPVFAGAQVVALGSRLLIIPGGEELAIVFVNHPTDATTMLELKLDSSRPSLAATPGGESPGPDSVIERTTIFGPLHVRELTLASEVIFDKRAYSVRRQAGCVRFSYVAPGSRTPRRYRCQPDLALEGVTNTAQQNLIRLRVRPTYTSRRYGDPGYAQLGFSCPGAIRTGAENGSEMGAFSQLMQPQRETNLRIRLNEYLPFGLNPGIIYVT